MTQFNLASWQHLDMYPKQISKCIYYSKIQRTQYPMVLCTIQEHCKTVLEP